MTSNYRKDTTGRSGSVSGSDRSVSGAGRAGNAGTSRTAASRTSAAGRTAGSRTSDSPRSSRASLRTSGTGTPASSRSASANLGTVGGWPGFSQMPPMYKVLVGVGLALVAIVLLRLFFLQVIKGGEYAEMAGATRTSQITTTPSRGTIYDRNGNVLAISVPATTIYAYRSEITDVDEAAWTLAQILGESTDYYRNLLSLEENEDDVDFVYVKRQADLQEAAAVRAMDLPGIYFLEGDSRREYPYGQVGGQIVGLCGIDGYGICGLELYYDDILSGTPGIFVAEIGESGLPIPGGVIESVKAVNGQDIMITIDITLQEELERELVKAKENENASSTSGIVMDASNGEILAIASLPLFNPADTSVVEDGATTISCISSFYEPGSTFKTVSATSLLENDLMRPTDTVFCPVEIEANERVVKDAYERGEETMSLNHMIAVSSNVGIALAVERYSSFDILYKDILRYGFTELTGVDYPGETPGYLDDFKDWSLVQAYNVSFGQGISVTALQLVRFYGALANDGVACTPHFLLTNITTHTDAEFPTETIIPNQDAVDDIAHVLRHVVTEGTGWQAAISDYYVVGKSGTAEIFRDGAYLVDDYNRSFIGYLVDTSTPIVCYFCTNDVLHEGSIVPVFRGIMKSAIERYRVTSQWDGTEYEDPVEPEQD